MSYKNINVPATLIHSVDGKKYRLNGTLVSINESLGTCTMKFGNRSSKNIPLDEVYLNEKFLDKIKELGKKAWNKIKGFVKILGGLVLPVDENNKPMASFLNLPQNVAMMDIPGVLMGLTSDSIEDSEAAGQNTKKMKTVDEVLQSAVEKDIADIEKYWGRVMKEYAKPENESLTLSQTVKMVNEKYYVPSKSYTALNEAVLSLHNQYHGQWGLEKTAKQLTKILYDNFVSLLNPDLVNLHRGHSHPSVCVWGAPGVGKSAIISKSNELLLEKGYNLDITHVDLASATRDSFTLPDPVKNALGDDVITEASKTWLPVYTPSKFKSEEDLILADAAYNAGIHNVFGKDTEELDKDKIKDILDHNKTGHNGGIIFFDEMSHLEGGVLKALMPLFGDRRFGEGTILASRWITVCAGNTLYDDKKANNDEYFRGDWISPLIDRMEAYRLVPTRKEWLEWARSPRSKTDKRQNIDEMFCEFIEQAPPYVWYDAFDFGGHNDELKSTAKGQGLVTALDNMKTSAGRNGNDFTDEPMDVNLSDKDLKAFDDFFTAGSTNRFNDTQQAPWTSRGWQTKIQMRLDSYLNDLFDGNKDKIEQCYTYSTNVLTDKFGRETTQDVKNIDMDKLGTMLNTIPEDKWLNWCDGDKADSIQDGYRLATKDRLQFFKEVIGEYILKGQAASQPKVAEEWKNWKQIFKYLTPKVMEKIWKDGTTGFADESLTYDLTNLAKYRNHPDIAWKGSSFAQRIVSEKLMSYYPGDPYKDLLDDIEKFKNNLVQATAKDVANLDRTYTVVLDNKEDNTKSEVSLLFQDDDPEEKKLLIATILLNSKFAQKTSKAMMYMALVGMQTGHSISSNFMDDPHVASIMKLYNDATNKSYSEHQNDIDNSIGGFFQIPEFKKLVPYLPASNINNACKNYEIG